LSTAIFWRSLPPDKFILWLNDEFFPRREEDLPRDLLELREFGLTIDWCENLRPHTKYFYALENYPDDLIVTADDDNFYLPDWLKILYEEHLKYPDCLMLKNIYSCRRLFVQLESRN